MKFFRRSVIQRNICTIAFSALIGTSLPILLPAQNINLDVFDSGATSEGFMIYGADASDVADGCIGAGDFNGDGFSDLIIAARDAKGDDDIGAAVGEVYVLFGNNSGFSNLDLATIENAAGPSGFKMTGSEYSFRTGEFLSAIGDINNDGYDDFMIQAQTVGTSPYGGLDDAGIAYVIFGKSSDFQNFDLVDIEAGDNTNGFAIFGAETDDLAASMVAGVGDINSDGFSDVLLGTNSSDGPGNSTFNAGGGAVIFGKAGGFSNINLADLESGASSDGFLLNGFGLSNRIGQGVSAAGDFNGDGFDDYILTSFTGNSPYPGIDTRGFAFLIFGGSSAGADIDLIDINGGDYSSGIPIIGPEDLAGVGRYDGVGSAGDINGDGFSDILVSTISVNSDNGLTTDVGAAYVIFGRPNPQDKIELSTIASAATSEGFRLIGHTEGQVTGGSLSGAGDINGDGYADILIGAHRSDGIASALDSSGHAYLVHGKPSGFTNIDLVNFEAGGTTDAVVIFGDSIGNRAGSTVSSAGDYNNDGISDFIVGTLFGDGIDNTRFTCGDAHLFAGSAITDSATYRSYERGGDAPDAGIGIVGDNTNFSSPFSRTFIDFADGTSTSSLQTVTITRNSNDIQNLNDPAGVLWNMSTDRTGWTNADIKLLYTDAQVSGYSESLLRIFQAPDPTGPWTQLNSSANAQNNSISANVSSFSYFTIAAIPDIVPPTPTIAAIDSPTSLTTITGIAVDFDEDVAMLETTDFITTGGLTVTSVNGGPQNYTIDLSASGDGVKEIQLPAGAVDDLATTPNASLASNVVSFEVDTVPPSTSVSTGDKTQVGGPINITVSGSDSGSGIDEIFLFVWEPGEFGYSFAGTVTTGPTTYTPSESGSAADGTYRFLSSSTDIAGNSEPAGGLGDIQIIYNDASNSSFAVSNADGQTTFPMTDTIDIFINFNATQSSTITLGRSSGSDIAPVGSGFDPSLLIDEHLMINGILTGTADLIWNYDPANALSLAGPLDTVFQFNGSTVTNAYSATPSGNQIIVNGITGFSDWFAGSNNADVDEWMILDD